jgi:hypothetical protein
VTLRGTSGSGRLRPVRESEAPAPPRWTVYITTERGRTERPVRARNALEAIALVAIVTAPPDADRVVVTAHPDEGE